MQLYNVRYALQHKVSKFDMKGKLISEEVTLVEQTLTMLPYPTAMQYSNLPNFRIEPYVMQGRGKSNYKHSNYSERKETAAAAKSKPKGASKLSGVKHAAATGDLGAAISGVK